jgi:dTDP-4-dehydrorhamnose reductase
MLGHRVAAAFADSHDVHATVRDVDAARRLGVRADLHPLDIHAVESGDALGALLGQVGPDVVVNCIGIVKQVEDAKRPIPSIRINALFPHELAEACAPDGTRMIHVSTDCVFSGARAYPAAYDEADRPDAEDLYGRTKALGEVGAPALTLRTSIIGPELHGSSGLLEWFRTQEGLEVPGFRNAWFSGLTTDAFADVIVELVHAHPGLAGIHHVSSEPISKYDLLVRLREALDVDCSIVAVDEPRINRVLDSSRFRRRTGISIPSWDDMLSRYRRESHVQTAR